MVDRLSAAVATSLYVTTGLSVGIQCPPFRDPLSNSHSLFLCLFLKLSRLRRGLVPVFFVFFFFLFLASRSYLLALPTEPPRHRCDKDDRGGSRKRFYECYYYRDAPGVPFTFHSIPMPYASFLRSYSSRAIEQYSLVRFKRIWWSPTNLIFTGKVRCFIVVSLLSLFTKLPPVEFAFVLETNGSWLRNRDTTILSSRMKVILVAEEYKVVPFVRPFFQIFHPNYVYTYRSIESTR